MSLLNTRNVGHSSQRLDLMLRNDRSSITHYRHVLNMLSSSKVVLIDYISNQIRMRVRLADQALRLFSAAREQARRGFDPEGDNLKRLDSESKVMRRHS